ncbi:MAG: MoaD/ThiS family protein [Candidatus Hodarchaeota archaeon]
MKLFATLRSYGPANIKLGESFSVVLEEDADVAALLKILNIPKDEAKLIMINGINGDLGDKPKEGDIIAIFPPVGGG